MNVRKKMKRRRTYIDGSTRPSRRWDRGLSAVRVAQTRVRLVVGLVIALRI
jgi:hypothetical protein